MRASLDTETLEELRSLGETTSDPEFLANLVDSFLDSAKKTILRMHGAFALSNAEFIATAAHSLKSSCGNLGAIKLYTLSHQLEQLSQTKSLIGADALLDQAEEELKLVESDLRDWLHNIHA